MLYICCRYVEHMLNSIHHMQLGPDDSLSVFLLYMVQLKYAVDLLKFLIDMNRIVSSSQNYLRILRLSRKISSEKNV